MAFLFRKKQKGELVTLESLFVFLFTGTEVPPSGDLGAPGFTLRPMAGDDPFPGKLAHLAFAGSNVPIAACVVGESLAPRARAWLSESGLASGILSPGAEIVWSSMEADGASAEAFRWQVLEMTPYALVSGDGSVAALVWLNEPIRAALSSRAEEENEKRAGKRGKKKAAEAAPEGESNPDLAASGFAPAGRVAAERARDLPALSAFLAQAFKAGERTYTTVPMAFGVCKDGSALSPAPEYPVWFKGSFEYLAAGSTEPKALSFIYALSRSAMPLKLSPADSTRLLSGLAGGIFAESAKRYLALSGLKPGRLAFKPLEAAPNLAHSSDLLYVDFSLRDSSLSVPGQLIAPTAALVPLARAWRVSLALDALARDGLSAVFDVNSRMLAKGLPAILQSPELRPRVPRFCVNELLRLLSDNDCRLVVQNVLIPDFGAKRLPEIVFHAVTVPGPDGQGRQAILPYGPLDSRRLDSFLPDAFKQGFYEQTRSLQAQPTAACAELNDQALHAIMRASLGGRIDASGRLKYLMREIVLKADRALAEVKLADLRAKGIPFGLLKDLEPKAAQRVAATVDDRDFALALIDSQDAMAGMRGYISMARTDRLREDIEFVRSRIDEGSLSLMDAYDAKEKIRLAIERDAERERAALAARQSPARQSPGQR
jgi:hypothetical protein